nr:xylulose kinase-1 [Tanacetum cinerariifolium]
MTLTFADTHNMVAYLSKSDASEGSDQIIDFINGSYIAYALTVNPTIYVSCIKQFWRTIAVKSSNDVNRLQALVDKNKVVVTKAAIRDALHLDDADGVDCLPNEEIFNELARMGRKFNFSKYIFESLVKNVDSSTKFYMYPRVGKGCSGIETPLFEGMLIAREPENQGNAEAEGDEEEQGTAAEEPVTTARIESSADTIIEDVSNQGRMTEESDKDKAAKVVNEEEETEEVRVNAADAQVERRQAEIYHIDMDHAAKVMSIQEEEEPEVQEVVEVVTTAKLITEVVDAASGIVSAAAVVPTPVTAATVTSAPVKVVVPATKRRRGRVGKGCSGVETPLFEGMLITKEHENQGNAEAEGDEEKHGTAAKEPVTAAVDDDQSIPFPTPLTPPPQQPQDIPSTSHVAQDLKILKLKSRVKKLERANKVKSVKLRRLRKVRTSQRIESLADPIMEDVSNQGRMTEESDKDEAAKVVNEEEETEELITEVVAAASGTVSAAVVVPTPVTTATVTPAPVKVVVPTTRRRRGVIIRDPEEESSINTPAETKSKTKERRYQVIKKRPITEAQARRNMMVYIKNTAGYRLDYFKEMSYDDIRPIFEAKFNSNLKFLLKTKEQIEEEESRAIAIINETSAQKAAKRRRLNEEAEDVEELKRHLEIVPDEDDDVFTEATLLAQKVPVVDY